VNVEVGVVLAELGGEVDSCTKVSAVDGVARALDGSIGSVSCSEPGDDVQFSDFMGKGEFVVCVDAGESLFVEEAVNFSKAGISGEKAIGFIAEGVASDAGDFFFVDA